MRQSRFRKRAFGAVEQPWFSLLLATLTALASKAAVGATDAALFTHRRAIISAGDRFPVTLAANGVDRATTLLPSSGGSPNGVPYGQLSAPVQVTTNDTVSIRFSCHVRHAVVRLYSNSAFDLLMGPRRPCRPRSFSP